MHTVVHVTWCTGVLREYGYYELVHVLSYTCVHHGADGGGREALPGSRRGERERLRAY